MFGSVRRVPVAGVEWGEGNLIPPDTLRRCRICNQPIEHLHKYRVVCSHPRCQRANRSMGHKQRKAAQQAARSPADAKRMQVAQAKALLRQAYKQGASGPVAMQAVAQRMGLRVVDVIALVKHSDEK